MFFLGGNGTLGIQSDMHMRIEILCVAPTFYCNVASGLLFSCHNADQVITNRTDKLARFPACLIKSKLTLTFNYMLSLPTTAEGCLF